MMGISDLSPVAATVVDEEEVVMEIAETEVVETREESENEESLGTISTYQSG